VPGLRPEIDPRSDLRALLELMRAIRAFRPDVIHTHTAKAGTLGRLAAVLTPGVSPVVVHTFHGHVLRGYFSPRVNAAFTAVERLLARKTDCLIGVSEATVAELVSLGVAPAHKFRALPIGLDLDHLLAVKPGQGSAFRAELGVSESDVLALFVGRLVPIKRVEVLLEATAIARSRGAALRLAIAGDGESRAELQRAAVALGVSDAVSFLGFRDDLPTLTAGSDLVVLSSDNEGTPVSLIEAAAAGRAAIATDVGGVAEIVKPATGILVRPGDPGAFAEALLQLVGDSDMRERMGRAGREHVRERFGAERLLSDIDGLYQELLSTHGHG